MEGNIRRSEGSESAYVAIVFVGIDIDTDQFKTGSDFVFEFGKGEGPRRKWSAGDDLDVAAEGGGSVVGNAEGEDGEGDLALGSFESDARGAALEGEMTGAEGAGAFGKDGESAAGGEEFVAAVHCLSVARVVAFGLVLFANDGDAGKEETREKISLELGGDHKDGGGEDGFVDPAVDGTVAMECDEESGAGEGGARGKDVEARKIETGAELGEEAIPEIWHEVEFTTRGQAEGAGVGGRVLER